MKIAIITANKQDADRVFTREIKDKLAIYGEVYDTVICRKNIVAHSKYLQDCECLMATWGMERYSAEEIREYFPRVRLLAYAAGSVQGFAKEFMDCGIKVCSAWRANAVPVAEYAFAEIMLANKGYFTSARRCRNLWWSAHSFSNRHQGNFKAKVGIVGAGAIGGMVCEKLKTPDVEVLCYDPYLGEERAKELNVERVSLERLFSECDVISNHLANKPELEGIYDYKLFSLCKDNATFINTGRGKQVDNVGLLRALREKKDMTAVLDVTYPEPPAYFSRLRRHPRVFLTPHIAGSMGGEVVRMAEYMVEELARMVEERPLRHEVSREMLETMA